MKLKKELLSAAFIVSIVLLACKKDDANNTPDYHTLIQGKWLWYKTITSSSQPNKYDTFYNQSMFKQFFADSTVITTYGNAPATTEKYFIVGNKLGQTYKNGADTAYSDIISINSNSFSVYDKVTYNNVNPPAVVEYWHYFIK